MNQRGSSPVELAAGVGLILVPIALMVLSFGPWLERRTFVRTSSREIARTYVLSGGELAPALELIGASATGHGIDPSRIRIGLCGAVPTPLTEGGADGCGPVDSGAIVSVTVEVDVPVVSLPWRDDAGRTLTVGGVTTSHTHVEMVDLYEGEP